LGAESGVSDGRPIRVLHVDDEEDQLRFTKMFLEELDGGVTVDSVSDPEEAVRLQGRNGYDIVVSDYRMATMTGIELFQRVRERSDVPFILYTGRGGEEVAESAFKMGVDGYVKKEVEPSHYGALSHRIRQLVEGRRARKLAVAETIPI
jgi:CheY-like chemotaxis protein